MLLKSPCLTRRDQLSERHARREEKVKEEVVTLVKNQGFEQDVARYNRMGEIRRGSVSKAAEKNKRAEEKRKKHTIRLIRKDGKGRYTGYGRRKRSFNRTKLKLENR